ncbi:MAG: epoxyqueuosine reductase QueH [Blautia wexlerae]
MDLHLAAGWDRIKKTKRRENIEDARNYQKELEKLIDQIQKENKVPRLFLHSCCAPCSSYVLEYLSKYFNITVFYYNPNIFPEEEYRKRVHEITRLVDYHGICSSCETDRGTL